LARQTGSTLAPYQTAAGGTIELIAAGVVRRQMFKRRRDDNRQWTWLIRAGGCLLMFVGFA